MKRWIKAGKIVKVDGFHVDRSASGIVTSTGKTKLDGIVTSTSGIVTLPTGIVTSDIPVDALSNQKICEQSGSDKDKLLRKQYEAQLQPVRLSDPAKYHEIMKRRFGDTYDCEQDRLVVSHC